MVHKPLADLVASGQAGMDSCMLVLVYNMVLGEVVVVASLAAHKGSSKMVQGYNIAGLEMGKDKGKGMGHLEKIYIC